MSFDGIWAEVRRIQSHATVHPPLPDASLCSRCGHVMLGAPGVEEALNARGIRARQGAEWACRCELLGRQRVEARMRWANLPGHEPRRTFGSFERLPGVEVGLEAASLLACDEGPTILVLSGETGCGKSHLLEAIGWELMDRQLRVRYEYCPDLLFRLKSAIGREEGTTPEDELRPLMQARVLLLDEIGLRDQPTQWEVQQLTMVVDSRLREGKRMAVATNLMPLDLEERFDPRLASRLSDRNTGAVHWVTITAGDYRRRAG